MRDQMTQTSRFFIALLAVFVMVTAPGLGTLPAQAQDSDAYRKLIAEATRLAYEKKYDEAIGKYFEAKTIQPDPVLDYNIARCYDKMGNCESATRHYNMVLDSEDAAPEDRTSAEKYLVDLGECEEVSEVVAVETPEVAPEDVPVVTESVESDSGSAMTGVAWGSTIAGGVFILSGLGLDVASASLADDYRAAAESGDTAAFDKIGGDIESRQSTVLILYGVGGAALTAGVVMLLLGDDDKGSDSVGIAPVLTPGLTGAVVEGRF
jgi:tetratricopeptide (TPR) repeat protein